MHAFTLLASLLALGDAASLFISPLGRDDGGCSSEAAACKTLSYATKQAQERDAIYVLSGVYTGTSNFIDLSSSTIPRNLTIASFPFAADPSKYIFDAQASSRMLTLGGGNSITGIEFRGSTSSYGILRLKDNAIATGCTFKDNSNAIEVYDTAYDVVVANVDIDLKCVSSCSTPGKGISIRATSDKATAKFRGVTINGADSKGTGIYMPNGIISIEGLQASDLLYGIRLGSSSSTSYIYHLTVDNAQFTYNTHGIYAYGKSSSTSSELKITNSKFDHHACTVCNGPAFFLGEHITAVVETTSFSHGNASGTGKGGAFFCDKSATLNMRGISFTNNVAYDSSPGWCDKNCGFFASAVINVGSSSEVETGFCRGL